MQLHKFNSLFLLLVLTSCSLTPLYKKDNNSCLKQTHKNPTLRIKVLPSLHEGYSVFKLKNLLNHKKHIIEPLLSDSIILTITVSENFASIGIDDTGDTLRNQGRIAVDIQITPFTSTDSKGTSVPIKMIKLDAVSSYNLEEADEFSSSTAKTSVRERLLIDLSEQIIMEVITHLKT